MIRTDAVDTDGRRKEIVWLALGLLAALGLALFLTVWADEAPALRYNDIGVPLGLLTLLCCTIAYIALKERENRQLNQSLVASLRAATQELADRMAKVGELTGANQSLSGAVEELKDQLDQAYMRSLRALMTTLDARDDYTALHGEQVTAVAVQLATRMGLESAVINTIRSFGPLHDIGKIGVPDRILHKQGPLDADEFALCLQHTGVGATIISPLRPRPEALAIVRNHHEWWNGQGYPDRLSGLEIPLTARIMAVADAYHAIISSRPYHAAATPTQAVQELMRNSGSQFDPDIVGVLSQLAFEGALRVRAAR